MKTFVPLLVIAQLATISSTVTEDAFDVCRFMADVTKASRDQNGTQVGLVVDAETKTKAVVVNPSGEKQLQTAADVLFTAQAEVAFRSCDFGSELGIFVCSLLGQPKFNTDCDDSYCSGPNGESWFFYSLDWKEREWIASPTGVSQFEIEDGDFLLFHWSQPTKTYEAKRPLPDVTACGSDDS